jgi:antitoxin VapB
MKPSLLDAACAVYHDIYQRVGKMPATAKAKVFMIGRSQAVRIPAEYRFHAEEVFIRRDPQTGDLILSEKPDPWEDIFKALDEAGFPEDFMAERGQNPRITDLRS